MASKPILVDQSSISRKKSQQQMKSIRSNSTEMDESPMCIFCRLEDNRKNMLLPCACKGTSGYVHFECLKMWIETSGNDKCKACRRTYCKITVIKKPVSFGKFFHDTDLGLIFSRTSIIFFVLFFICFMAQFHCKLLFWNGARGKAIFIAVLNTFFLSLYVFIYTVYLITMYLAFSSWRKENFNITVLPMNRNQTKRNNHGHNHDAEQTDKANEAIPPPPSPSSPPPLVKVS